MAAVKPLPALDVDMMVDLHRSGLEDADARMMKLEYCEAAPEGISPAGAGYIIPYFDTEGAATGFYRYRYLVDTRTGFERLSGGKQRRYTQPVDSTPQVYWPPYVDWAGYAEGVEFLIITEGEKKAAAASKAGLPCIGLGGVWSFQNAPRNEPLLPELSGIEWNGRDVYIIYDSDAADKLQIQMAEYRLARRLLRMGAKVKIVRLPAAANGDKQGLDDFIQAEGPDELMDLMQRGEPFSDSAALHALNTEVTYVKDPGIVYVNASGQQVNPDAFKAHRFADLSYTKLVTTATGSRMEDRSTATDWLRWPGRNAVERLEFEPGQPAVTEGGALNLWRGWKYSPKEGNCDPWHELLDHLFEGQPKSRKWFEQWCAFPFQNPGAKQRSAVAMWGRMTGTGKSVVGYTLGDLYGDAFSEIGDDQIEKNDFNSWARSKQFVLGDDITGNNNRKVANALKVMITREQIQINIKHVAEYYTRDCINYYFTSNSPDAFLLDENDRRFFIHEVPGHPLPDEFYTDCFTPWRMSERGRRALMHYLLYEVDCSDFSHTARPPMTDAKREMIRLTRTDLESWLMAVREEPDSFCKRYGGTDLATVAEMAAVYDPQMVHKVTQMTFARKLKEVGIPRADAIDRPPGSQLRVAPANELVRLYVLRNHKLWANSTADAMRDHYEATRRIVKGAPKKY